MNKKFKTITKILMMIIISIAVLLILPKNEFAYESISGNSYPDNSPAATFFERLQHYSIGELKNQNIVKNWIETDMGNFTVYNWDHKGPNSCSSAFAASAMRRRIRD